MLVPPKANARLNKLLHFNIDDSQTLLEREIEYLFTRIKVDWQSLPWDFKCGFKAVKIKCKASPFKW